MNPNTAELLKRYTELEQQFQVADHTDIFGSLVTASTNKLYPIQKWFHFKESFSIDLLDAILTHWHIPKETIVRILDPFCGTGTLLLAAQRLAKRLGRSDLIAVGFERNPFLHFVSSTKANWHDFHHEVFSQQATYLLNGASKAIPDHLPELSSLHREEIFAPDKIKEILAYKNAIDSLQCSERDLLLLGYASALEDLSGTRKDGRMIRIVKSKQQTTVAATLKAAWEAIARDIQLANEHYLPIDSKVIAGDGRILTGDSSPNTLSEFDLVLYSPPYLNNIDYTEVYKIEMWLTGFVNTNEDFRSLRYSTFRSHPSVKFTDPITYVHDDRLIEVQQTLNLLVEALPKDKNRVWRTQLFKGYFDDMYQSLQHQYRVTRSGGWIFSVIGNSLHGSDSAPENRVPVASDLIVASIADSIGLEVKSIQVARHLRRRGPDGHLLRESIIAMQKP